MIEKQAKHLDIVVIGTGNVAFHLSMILKKKGHKIVQVLGRTEKNASDLAAVLQCENISNPEEINRKANLYLLCVPDSAIVHLTNSLPFLDGILVHTSGSTSMQSISRAAKNFGVLYPFQTFTKGRDVDFKDITFCIEANSSEVLGLLADLVLSLGAKPLKMDYETRKWLHIAGVFSSNFVNHMLAISYLITKEKGIPFDILKPLISETVKKAMDGNPVECQTGPAIRGDSETIRNHAAMLSSLDEDIRDIYMSLSTSILNLSIDNQ